MKEENQEDQLLLSDKLEAFSDSVRPKQGQPNFKNYRALFLVSSSLFRAGVYCLLVFLSIDVFGPLYTTALERYGSTPTALGLSVLILIPIVISIGIQMLPYYVVLPDAPDSKKAEKKALQYILLTKKMLPTALWHLPCIAGAGFFCSLCFAENFSAIQGYNYFAQYLLCRPPLLIGVEFTFFYLHHLAHAGHTSKNPIVRWMAKTHQKHHYENNDVGLVPLSLLYDDLGETIATIAILLGLIVPFGGGHPQIIFPTIIYYYCFDGAWVHNKMVPFLSSKHHVDHHLHRKGNYGFLFLADLTFGTLLD